MNATDMNPNDTIDIERHLLAGLATALVRLRATTGLKATIAAIEPALDNGHRADAWLDVEHEGAVTRYVVEAKNKLDRFGTLGHVKAQAAQMGYPAMLVAPHVTNAMAQKCRELDLPFIDFAGNAYLKLPDFYVYIAGERPVDPNGTGFVAVKPRGGTTAGLRIVFALLCKPELLNATYREIAQAAGVAVGNVGELLADLKTRGFITDRDREGNIRFKEPVRLFEEWVTNYPIKLRPKLKARRFAAEQRDWWKTAVLDGVRAWWGGEVAADRLTHYLTPATCTLYVGRPGKGTPDDALRIRNKIAAQYRFRADENGNTVLIEAFWNFETDNPERTVPPILVYADLVATLDPRNIETANKLREQYIEPALRQL